MDKTAERMFKLIKICNEIKVYINLDVWATKIYRPEWLDAHWWRNPRQLNPWTDACFNQIVFFKFRWWHRCFFSKLRIYEILWIAMKTNETWEYFSSFVTQGYPISQLESALSGLLIPFCSGSKWLPIRSVASLLSSSLTVLYLSNISTGWISRKKPNRFWKHLSLNRKITHQLSTCLSVFSAARYTCKWLPG